MNDYQSTIETLIRPLGICINGTKPQDVKVHNERFFPRVLRDGSLGLGESYMEGWWDCTPLDEFLYLLISSDLDKKIKRNLPLLLLSIKARLQNRQSKSRAISAVEHHYDLDNDFFAHMLDKYMMYSCAYWENASSLDEAQERKLDLICRKLKLAPGLKVLDIGCGWGGFAQYAAEKYQVEVTGITLSSEQAAEAKKRCEHLPVHIRVQDYRTLNEKFDRIVSIGMFEHVGYKNYQNFMTIVHRNLTTEGIFLLHCIGGNESVVSTDPWIDRYIFPNGMMPSATQITRAFEKYFILQDWHNFGPYYDLTLMEWLRRFKASWPLFKDKFGQKFYRMWEYYLCLSAASFRARTNNLWQIVLTGKRFSDFYKSVR